MGIETEFGVTCTFHGHRRLSPDEVARYLFRRVVSWGRSSNVFLRNGARLYLDVGSHPEYATAECDSLLQLVTHDRAGERVLEDLLIDAEQRLAEEGIGGDILIEDGSGSITVRGVAGSVAIDDGSTDGTFSRMRQFGAIDNKDPRGQSAKLEGVGARAVAAQQNAWEALAVFIAGVVAFSVRGGDPEAASTWALVWAGFLLMRRPPPGPAIPAPGPGGHSLRRAPTAWAGAGTGRAWLGRRIDGSVWSGG